LSRHVLALQQVDLGLNFLQFGLHIGLESIVQRFPEDKSRVFSECFSDFIGTFREQGL
jgi:hypothetical protein